MRSLVTLVVCLCLLVLAAPAMAQRSQTPIVKVEETGIGLPGIGPEQDFGAANLPDQIRAYRASGAWDRQIARIGKLARRYLRRKVRRAPKSLNPAMVLDIDDTSLSNWAFWEPLNFDYTRADGIVDWIMSAQDPPILPTRSLYRVAQRLDVAVFFITGRAPNMRAATERNLAEAGYGGPHRLILKPTSYTRKSVIPYKSSRRCRIEASGYAIFVNVGDQYSDLAGGCADRAFKIPNPMYFLP